MEEVEEELEKKTAEEEERLRKEVEVSFNRNIWEFNNTLSH
jgi:putative transposon-encoded protein